MLIKDTLSRYLGFTSALLAFTLFIVPSAYSLPVEIQQNLFHAWMSPVNYRTDDPESWLINDFDAGDDAITRLFFPVDIDTEAELNAHPYYGSRIWTMVYDGSIEFTNLAGARQQVSEFPEWGWPTLPVPIDVANNPDDDPPEGSAIPDNNLRVDQMHLESERGNYRVMTNYWNTRTVIPDQLSQPAELPLEVGSLLIEVEDGTGYYTLPPAQQEIMPKAGAFTVLSSPDSFWRFGRPRISGKNSSHCNFGDEFFSDHPCQWAPDKPLNPLEAITASTTGNHAPAAYPSIYNGCHYGQCTKPGKVADPRNSTDARFVVDSQGVPKSIAGAPYPIRMDQLTGIPSHWTTDATRANIDLCIIPRSGIPRFCDNEVDHDGDPSTPNPNTMFDDAIFNVAYDIWIDKNTPRTDKGMFQQGAQFDDDGDGEFDRGSTAGVTVPWPYKTEPADTSTVKPLLPEFPKQMKQNDGLEIMIWVAHNGYLSQETGDGEVNPAHPSSVIRPAGQRIATRIPIDGVSGLWDVWSTLEDADGNNKPFENEFANWYVLSYVRVTDGEGSGLDLKSGVVDFQFDSKWFVNHAATMDCGYFGAATKCLQNDWWITSIQAGFEIWANGEQLESKFFDAKPSTVINIVQSGRFSSNGYVEVDAGERFLATAACDKPVPGDSATVRVEHPDGTIETKIMTPDVLGVLTAEFEDGMKLPAGEETALAEVFYDLDCASGNSRDLKNLVRRVDVVKPADMMDIAGNVIPGSKVELYYRPDTSSSWVKVPHGSTDYLGSFNLNNPTFTSQYGGFAWEINKTGYYKVRGGYGSCHAPGNPSVPYIESPSMYRTQGSTIADGDDLILECPSEMPKAGSGDTTLYCDWYSDGLYPMCDVDTGWWGWENNANCISQSACDSTGNETVVGDGSGGDSDWLSPSGAVDGPTRVPNGYGPDAESESDNEDFIHDPEEDPVPEDYTIIVNARGTSGTEKVRLTVGGNLVAEWVLSTSFSSKAFTTDFSGGINVEYVNDFGHNRDVVIDYVEIAGVRHEAEDQTQYSGSASGTGNCSTGQNHGWIHCNGYIGFSAYK